MNKTIGTMTCPICGEIAEVREDKNHKLYWSSKAGLIAPRTVIGQDYIKNNMTPLEGEQKSDKPNKKGSIFSVLEWDD